VFNRTPAKRTAPYPVKVSRSTCRPGGRCVRHRHIFFGDSDATCTTTRLPALPRRQRYRLARTQRHGAGVRDAPIVDSTNAVGYVTSGCTVPTLRLCNSDSAQHADLQEGRNFSTEGCNGAIPLYAPTLDNAYLDAGINSGHVLACVTHGGSIRLSQFAFTTGTMNAAVQFDDQFVATGARSNVRRC